MGQLTMLVLMTINAYRLALRSTRARWLLHGLMLFGFLALSLAACRPKAKPATPVLVPAPVTVDSTRLRLQQQADASRSRAGQPRSTEPLTNYQTDRTHYDSLPNPLR